LAVRRESVVLDLQSNFPRVAAESAASIALLNNEVKRLGKESVGSRSGTRDLGNEIGNTGRQAESGARSIDKYSGRLALLGQVAVTLGPALVPIGAVGIPAVTGLASSFGFAALGAGVMIGSLQGVGDALKKLNKANLQPTTANLAAAQAAMDNIGPAAQKFTMQLAKLEPELKNLRDIGASQMLPGLTEGIASLQTALPAVQRIVGAVAGELGKLGAEAGKSLAGPEWRDFFTFLATEAPKAIDQMAHGVGNLAHGFAELWMAFAPLNSSFSGFLLDSTAAFEKWATGLSKTQGFAEFVNYIQTNGPVVGQALGAIANALLQIVEATAPLGGPVLHVLTAVADALAKIADSNLGTPILLGLAALSLYNRAMATAGKLTTTTFGARAKAQITGYGASLLKVTSAQERASRSVGQAVVAQRQQRMAMAGGAAQLGLMAVAATGMADKVGMANTATLALAGSFLGPWGAAAGAAVGLTIDLAHANDDLKSAVTAAQAAMNSGNVDKMRLAYAALSKQIQESQASTQHGLLGTLAKAPVSVLGIANTVKDHLTNNAVDDAQAQQSKIKSSIAVAKAVAAAAVASRNGAAASTLLAHGYSVSSVAALRASATLAALRKTTSETAAKFITLGADVNNAKVSLNGWIRQLAANARALQNFGKNAATAAHKGLRDGLIRELQALGPEGAMRMRQLANATKSQIAAANRAWASGQRAARQYGNEIGRIPRTAPTSVKLTGADAAVSRVVFLRNAIASLHDRTLHVTVIGRTVGKGVGLQARGGMWMDGAQYFGKGGFGDIADRHQPELTKPGGTMRVWSEPETKGEAYIPLANDDRRPRARAIAEQTVEMLGGDVAWYARGGTRGGGGTQSKHLQDALDKLRATIAKDTARRDALASKRDDLKSTVAGSFMSDPFAGGNVWAKGGGDPTAIIKADIAKAKAFRIVLGKLHAKGLDGDALAAVAATGDIGKAQALLAQGKAGVGAYESAINQREKAANAVGAYAGQAAYGVAINHQSALLKSALTEQKHIVAEMKHLRAELKHHPKATGQHVGHAINSAASKGHRHKRGH
jgi:hypothetical protein